MSPDATFSPATDAWLKWFPIEEQTPLAAGASYVMSGKVTLPGNAIGVQYLIFVVDGGSGQGETDEANNILAKPITLNAPDLTIIQATAPDTANLGQIVELNWTVKNQGAFATTATWYDHIYLSDDQVVGDGDTAIGYASSTSMVAAGGDYTQTLRLILPETRTGDRYLLFVADGSGQQGETDESNNTFARPIKLDAPDMIVTEVIAPGTGILSQNIEVTWKVRNQGAVNADNPWFDAVYASQDAVWDSGDTLLQSFWMQAVIPVAANATYAVTKNITLPSAGAGDRYLIFVADAFHYQGEADETNNTKAVLITLGAPDLILSESTAPGTAISGDTIQVGWKVTNVGNSAAPADWVDGVYLSADATLDGSDRQLVLAAVKNLTPLTAQAGYNLTSNVFLKGIVPGDYFDPESRRTQ